MMLFDINIEITPIQGYYPVSQPFHLNQNEDGKLAWVARYDLQT